MKELFSNFVRQLDGRSEGLDPEFFDEVWTALRAILRRELKRRDLWHLPPSYLGVSGRARWSEGSGAGGSGVPSRDDALEELAADCYSYVFLTRLDSLRAQLKVKPNVEGLVLLGIRSFLLERRRHFDPIGSRVYEVLRSALQRGVADEVCFVQADDRRIRSDTIILFGKGKDRNYRAASEPLLVETARAWADELLPDLVTCVGRAQRSVESRILLRLRRFPEQGVDGLRFGALLNPLKTEVRSRWGTMFHRSLGDVAFEEVDEGLVHLVRSVQPDTSFEQRESFTGLSRRITFELEHLDADQRTVGDLLRLWELLRTYALIDGEPDRKPPSQRNISKQLRIPRDRLPGLWRTLREVVRKHRSEDASRLICIREGVSDAS